jgi:hypothetical protein
MVNRIAKYSQTSADGHGTLSKPEIDAPEMHQPILRELTEVLRQASRLTPFRFGLSKVIRVPLFLPLRYH